MIVFTEFTQRKISMLAKKYCKNLDIKLAFSSFKIKNLLTGKDRVHRSLRSCVVYKFSCAGCNSVYIGETTRHLSTRVREHLYTDKNSHIFKHLKIHLHVKVFVMKAVSKYWIQLTIIIV